MSVLIFGDMSGSHLLNEFPTGPPKADAAKEAYKAMQSILMAILRG